jgi:hypothetical protein
MGISQSASLLPEELALASLSKDEATVGASSIETALTRRLTIRI